jgi:hypothetical protein
MPPESDLVKAFRKHFVPEIRKEIDERASFVARGWYQYGNAVNHIMRFALRRGMASLPEKHFNHTEDWIHTRLARKADEGATMGNDVSKAKHQLHVTKDTRQQQATEFWQQFIRLGRLQSQTDGQQQKDAERPIHQPRQ